MTNGPGPTKLSELPSLAKLRNDFGKLRAIAKAEPYFGPLLGLFGADRAAIKRVLLSVAELENQVDRVVNLPDRFNDAFAKHGWIMHSNMDTKAATEALEEAEQGKVEEAQAVLIRMYTPEFIRRGVLRLTTLDAFRPRMALLELAVEDHLHGRYHASVPVFLALLDGAVGHALRANKGFFAEGADLNAWDSIVGHDRSLGRLVQTMTPNRKQTRTERISIPYRHGILHGMDLGYANEEVSVKAFAAVLAASELVRKLESSERVPPPKEAEPSLRTALRRYVRVIRDRERIERWTPRDLKVGADIHAIGQPNDYGVNTPERATVEFLKDWQRRNFGNMASHFMALAIPAAHGHARAGAIRRKLGTITLLGFELADVRDLGVATAEVSVRLRVSPDGQGAREIEVSFRLVFEDAKGAFGFDRDDETFAWRLVNWDEPAIAF